MICYEVFINGKKKCVAGVGGAGVLAAHLTWVKREQHEADDSMKGTDGQVEDLFVSVGGLTYHGKDSVYLDWVREDLKVGDEVRFRIIEKEMCDPPQSSRTETAELVEEKRREYYETMKKEYEGMEGGA
jgi:hypothetical protein